MGTCWALRPQSRARAPFLVPLTTWSLAKHSDPSYSIAILRIRFTETNYQSSNVTIWKHTCIVIIAPNIST